MPTRDGQATRGEILDALRKANATAKGLRPSPAWDSAHRYLNMLLDQLEVEAIAELGVE